MGGEGTAGACPSPSAGRVFVALDQRAGRPSLTGKALHSPQVTFRVTPELRARAEAEAKARGTTVSQLAREAFERFFAS